MKRFFSITSIILICLAFTQKIYSKENKIILKINNEIIQNEKFVIEIKLFSENFLKLSIGKKRHLKIKLN